MAGLRSNPSRLQPARQSRIRVAPKRAESFYLSPAWRELVARLTKERGRRCEACGDTNPARLIGDHIQERRDGGAELEPSNVRLLCLPCHNRKTARARQERLEGSS